MLNGENDTPADVYDDRGKEKMKIVLVEDDSAFVRAAEILLQKKGYEVLSFYSAETLIDALPQSGIDLFILDINLPKMDGLSLMEVLRPYFESSDFIFISAYDDISHISRAFDLGCEDYLKKPFEMEEMLLRVEKIVKRRTVSGIAVLDEECRYHIEDRLLVIGEDSVELTEKEGQFLELLVKNRGSIVSYDTISEQVWNEPVPHNTIASVVRRLRRKMDGRGIVSVRGRGYRLI